MSICFRWADRIVVGAALSLQQAATYQILFVMTATFDLIAVGLGYVSMPQYARQGSWRRKNLAFVAVVAGLAALATASIAVTLGTKVLLIRWDRATVLTLSALVGVGIAKLAYAELSAVVGGLGGAAAIMRFSAWMALSLLAGVFASIWLGLNWGLPGAAAGALIAWLSESVLVIDTRCAHEDGRFAAGAHFASN